MEMNAVLRIICFHVPSLLLLTLSCHVYQSSAADCIPSGARLPWNETIISAGGVFELGFFSPGNSSRHYLGIWYKKISARTVVWVANREKPIAKVEASFLKVSDGSLVLFSSQNGAPIWSSETSTTSNSTAHEAILLDTGNLVIQDSKNSSIVRWQSFDNPTDTWFPRAHLGMNKVTRKYTMITSWKNSEDPAPGPYSMRLDPDGLDQVVLMWNRSMKYWWTGKWDGRVYSGVDAQLQIGGPFKIRFFNERTEKYTTYYLSTDSMMATVILEPSGILTLFVWKNVSEVMQQTVWSRPFNSCDVYSLCGAYGVCRQTTPHCQCSFGFQPVSEAEWKLNDWSNGCVRRRNLSCTENSIANSAGGTDEFLEMHNVRKPANPLYLRAEGVEVCRSACLRNCTCTAFAYTNSCLIWNEDLLNLAYTDSDSDLSLYVRLAASEFVAEKRKHKNIAVLVCAASLTAIFLCGSMLIWRVMRSRSYSETDICGSINRFTYAAPSVKAIDGSLNRFTYAALQQVTRNFSDRLGGGSFGSVFKGRLPDSTAVAVKKLEHYKQGEKQFLTEVRSLGTIQHVNLVRLHGFCSEKENRLLVYEYMPNDSLASQLFGRSPQCMDWKRRYNVALETAKGLSYLHEECKYCIIHCDIKPENILLDEDYRAKVADLGFAELLGRDFSRVLTTMRGTIGYLAPEWISGVPITPKADVYSYGMMLFEIISGKRNVEHTQKMNGYFFPIWAANQIQDGDYLSSADESLRGDINEDELIRACRVACWCIQDNETDRPSMRQIVRILEGILEVSLPPVPLLLQQLMEDYDTSNAFPNMAFHSIEIDNSNT